MRPAERHLFSQAINAGSRAKSFAVVEHAVKASLGFCTIWKEEIEDSIKSAVGCLRIYFDNSLTSLPASSHSFYFLNVILLNFTEHVGRELIVASSTVNAYLPIR